MIKKNTVARTEITGITDLGYGVGRIDGVVTFVSGAVTGDVCDVRVIKVSSSYMVGRVETMVSPSTHRVLPKCRAKGCGGCAYKLVDYKTELEIKRDAVVHAFAKAGVEATVREVQSTGKTEHYRNKAQYPVSERDGKYTVGFFAPKSHRVVEAADCPLQSEAFRGIVEIVRNHLEKYSIPAYDENSKTGLVRHIYLREASSGGDILLTLVLTSDEPLHIDELVQSVTAAQPRVRGIVINVNPDATNVICGDVYRTVWGRGYIEDTLCGVRLKVTPQSFYQVNHDGAEMLYSLAADAAGLTGRETLVDLFCGTGSVGLTMASRVSELIGIEIVPDAVRCAKENAEANDIKNAHFYCGDADCAEGLLASAERECGHRICPDVVVVDPPRRGCGDALVDYLVRLAPEKIVYISCNPDTLARDCAKLILGGYSIGEVIPVDMFPRTGHVECVVCLQRQTK